MANANDIAVHISRMEPDTRKVYKALRTLAKKNMPGVREILYHNSLGYSLTSSPWDRVCYIAHQSKGYVNFGFFFGVDLPDPKGLIQGKGKRIRHVKVYNIEQARDPRLAKLIAAAWEKSEKDITVWRNSLRKQK